MAAAPTVIDTGEIALSALQATSADPAARGLIVALHGGSCSAGYWDGAGHADLSLLRLGAGLGFHVLAPDRPGYGGSHGCDPRTLGHARQAEILFDAVDAWCDRHGHRGPVFLIGHSIGGILALQMAAHERGGRLAGIDVAGVPFRFAGSGGREVNAWATDSPYIDFLADDDDARRRLLYGPEGSYDAAVFDADRGLQRPMPLADYRDGIGSVDGWPQVMPAITVPVQYTVAEFEAMQETGWPLLTDVGRLLHNSRHLVLHLQRAAAHNVSLHKVGRAYHLRALAFFEECLALERR